MSRLTRAMVKYERMPAIRAIVGHGQAGAAIIGRHQADRVGAIFSGQADSRRGIADAARERTRSIGVRKKSSFSRKNGRFSGKVHGIALVDRDLRVLGLDLAEVGIRGQVDDEVIVDDELRVHADLALGRRMLKIWIRGIARVEGAKAAHQAIGNQVDAVAGRNSFEPIQSRGLAQAALDLVGNLRPEGIFVLARDAAIQNDSPLLLLASPESAGS